MSLLAILFASFMIFTPAEHNVVTKKFNEHVTVATLENGDTTYTVAGKTLVASPLDYSKMND